MLWKSARFCISRFCILRKYTSYAFVRCIVAHQSPDARRNSFKRTLHRNDEIYVLNIQRDGRLLCDLKDFDAIFILLYPRLCAVFFSSFAYVKVVPLDLAFRILFIIYQ